MCFSPFIRFFFPLPWLFVFPSNGIEDGKMCALALATRSLAILSINEMLSKEDPCSHHTHSTNTFAVCRNVLEMAKAVESFSMATDNR